MRVFSKVVALGRMLVIWYERAMPLREMRSGDAPVMSSPSNRMCPEDGRNTPVRQLKNVLLPAPFGPITARTSPRSTAKLTRLSAVRPPKRTVRSLVASNGPAASGKNSSKAAAIAFKFMFSSGEMTGWRHHRLLPRDCLEDVVFPVLDFEDELTREGLMVFFAQHLVAGREIG